MVIFYKKWKQYNENRLTKIKMDLNNRKMTNHPLSTGMCRIPDSCDVYRIFVYTCLIPCIPYTCVYSIHVYTVNMCIQYICVYSMHVHIVHLCLIPYTRMQYTCVECSIIV